MALKDDWKDTGKDLGGAFTGLGKTLIRTAKVGVDKVNTWADGGDPKEAVPEENVTNDGSWRETGKDLGGAFAELGKTLLHTAKAGADGLSEKLDRDAPAAEAPAEKTSE